MFKKVVLGIKFLLRDSYYILFDMMPTILRVIRNRRRDNVIFFFDVPTYSNLGDQAIGYAQELFLKDFFPHSTVVRIFGFMVKYWVLIINLMARPNDLVVHIGGGNFGDLYPEIDVNRENIINRVKRSKIVLFPQTIYYSDTKYGHDRLVAMQKAIQNNHNVYLLARDNESFLRAKRYFKCKTFLCPDMVLYLNRKKEKERKDVLLCLRNDIEKMKPCFCTELLCSQMGLKWKKIDTIYNGQVNINKRNEILENMWDDFASSKLVITDRLHGMIFSAITNTPCIVLPNNNGKIEDFYNTWFLHINFIQFVKREEQFKKAIVELRGLDKENYNVLAFKAYYDSIACVLHKIQFNE